MTQQWRVLDLISFDGEIHSTRGAVEIAHSTGELTRIPVADLAMVLVGHHVTFSGATLHRFVSGGVPVMLCDWKGIPEGASYSWTSHGRAGARQRAQVQLSLPRQKNAWAKLVSAKIRGQAATLTNLGLGGAAELLELAKRVRSGDPGNIEAQAARLYWQTTLGRLERRIPGSGSASGRNACLDYGYTILRGHAIRATLAAGLIPSVGLFHHGRSNQFALVDDLIEPFRPCVDEVVFSLDPEASPSDSSTKRILVRAADQQFSMNGSSIPTALSDLAQRYGKYCEGDATRLRVDAWEGPSSLLDSVDHG